MGASRFSRALFPLTYIATTSSLTVILIGAGLSGRADLAADLAVAQGAMIAVFLAFSANLRNLILQRSTSAKAQDLLAARILMLPALCAVAYVLGTHVAGVPVALCIVVIARRACEWLAEVHLNVLEVEADRRPAAINLAVQALATLLVIVLHAWDSQYAIPGMWLWALSPLVVGFKVRPERESFSRERLAATFRALLPHAGSSVMVGLAIYLLRVIVVASAGRQLGGLILTGVAAGSFAGTLFANVVGPSAALGSAAFARSRLYLGGVGTLLAGGIAVLAAAASGVALPGAPPFWFAVGLSLLGSALMIEAQRVRLRLFEQRSGDELFAADVLRSVALLVCTLVAAYLLQPRALVGVYFADAALTWLFYTSASRRWVEALGGAKTEAALRIGIAVLIVLPMFFQLSGRIFRIYEPLSDSGGVVRDLPLPVSLLACFGGIVLLGRYRQASLATAAAFLFFVCLSLATLVSAGGASYDTQKVVLLIQFMLPAFALVLGQIIEPRASRSELVLRTMFYTVAGVAAVQLALTVAMLEPNTQLTHDLVLFSIYQHRQFVPVVFVGAFLAGLFALWRSTPRRWPLWAACAVMALYTVHSYSTLALALLAFGIVGFVIVLRGRERSLVVLLLVFVVAATAMAHVRGSKSFREKYEGDDPRPLVHAKKLFEQQDKRLPENIARRLDDWMLFGGGMVEGVRPALFGHAVPIDRAVATSAHNYYLDLGYNFGLLGLLPIIGLAIYTVVLLVRRRRAVLADPALFGAALVVLFVLALDNNMKVSLRQPYPGVFVFFLWGLVLSRLARLEPLPREEAQHAGAVVKG